MPGSNGYSIDPALMELDPIGSQLSYEENVDDNQEFYFLLNNLQKQAGRRLKPEQINAITLQWNANQNGYLDRFRQMVLSKMGLQNTVNTQELARNKMRLDANRIGEGMTNVSKVNLLSTIRSRLPKLENFEKPVIQPTPKPVLKPKVDWNARAAEKLGTGKTMDDVIALQTEMKNNMGIDLGKYGIDGKWGEDMDKAYEIYKLKKAAEELTNPYAGRMLGTTTRNAQQQVVNNYKAPISLSQETPPQNTSSANTVQATVNRAAAKFPGSNNSKKAFFGLADSDAVINLLGDAWNATKGFMSKAGDYLAGPKEPIQTNTPVYGRKNIFMETGKTIHDTFGNANKHKKGGNINKFNNGGKPMNQKQMEEAFVQFLILDAQAHGIDPNDQQAILQYILSLGKEGLAAKQQEFMQRWQGTPSRKLGGHLAYLSKLKGNCPDGEEMVYMKEGGRVCPKCVKKAEKAKPGTKLEKNAISDFKEKRKIAPSDTVHVNGQPRSLTDSQNRPLVKGMKTYSVSEYQKDMKDAKKGKKDAANRVEKSDMKTAYGCGGATKKLVKKKK